MNQPPFNPNDFGVDPNQLPEVPVNAAPPQQPQYQPTPPPQQQVGQINQLTQNQPPQPPQQYQTTQAPPPQTQNFYGKQPYAKGPPHVGCYLNVGQNGNEYLSCTIYQPGVDFLRENDITTVKFNLNINQERWDTIRATGQYQGAKPVMTGKFKVKQQRQQYTPQNTNYQPQGQGGY